MDLKKIKAPTNTITRDMMSFSKETGNVYESVMIVAKRANQISKEIKEDIDKKIQEFAAYSDELQEVFENKEQIEISKFYEKLPKPSLIAASEFEDKKLYYRNKNKESK